MNTSKTRGKNRYLIIVDDGGVGGSGSDGGDGVDGVNNGDGRMRLVTFGGAE